MDFAGGAMDTAGESGRGVHRYDIEKTLGAPAASRGGAP